MRAGHLGIAAALAVAVSGCGSGINVRSDWNPATDFSTYHTFAVLDEAGSGQHVGQLVAQRIKTAITSTLEAKGMRQANSPDNADVSVGWQVTTEQRSSYQTVNTGWGSYGRYGRAGWYGGGVGMTTSHTTETRYDVGTLVIAVFDESLDEMVFTSTGSKRLDTSTVSPDEAQRRITAAVETILRDYPPGG
jgi:hypothetical protein